MQILSYLFILLLALGATCTNDSKNREIPSQTETSDTSSEAAENRQENKNSTARPLQEAQEELDTLYLITGTEPFWSLTVARPRSVYTSADGDTLVFDFKEARTAIARQEEYLQVFELGNAQQLVLRKTSSNCPCSDGMSNKAYPYQATLMLAEKILEGCGRKPEAGS